MKEKLLLGSVIGALVCAGMGALVLWLRQDAGRGFTAFVPGMDGRAAAMTNLPAVAIGEYFVKGSGVAATNLSGSWPRFRGADFNNIAAMSVPLADTWPTNGPRVLWSLELGEGHAGPAVAEGRVYVLDYDEQKKGDALRCLSLDDGRELWRRWYKVSLKRNHGISRTVPAVSSNYVVSIGPNCHVMCVKADSGELLWGIDLVKEYGTKVPGWYTGQCPLIDDGLALIAPAGTNNVLVMAVECATGKVVWQTPNPRGWLMSHSSLMPMTLNGTRMFVYAASGGLAGIAADGPRRGTVLWESTAFNHAVVAPSPVCMADGRIFITAGYGAGSAMLKLTEQAGVFTAQTIRVFKPGEGLASEQQTPLYWNGRLFSILPKDAGPHRNEFVCCNPDDCSTFIWTSGKDVRFGLGPSMIADGKMFILDDLGELTMVRASTTGWEPLAKAKVLNGKDAWGPMALVNGRLLLRDEKRMICLDVGK